MNKQIEQFSQAAINIIIQDIMEIPMVIPRLVFDYSIDPNITNGYYMYQNVTGDVITLNMNSIMTLKQPDDIKTVITYSFIHEIAHMWYPIDSRYKTDRHMYTLIEDTADNYTIYFIENNLDLINKRLKFQFNIVFLKGIKRQLTHHVYETSVLDDRIRYYSKMVAGAICAKLNINFDYLYNALAMSHILKVVFPDKREYYLDLWYGEPSELNILINLIYLTEINIVHVNYTEYIEGYKEDYLVLTLI